MSFFGETDIQFFFTCFRSVTQNVKIETRLRIHLLIDNIQHPI